jgi:hypothetical protein
MADLTDNEALVYASRIPRALGFHVLNCLLGVAGFAFILSGFALSIGLLALCFVGVLVFRALLLVTPLLVKLDVALHNLMAPPDRQLCERSAAQVNESRFLERRLALMGVVYLTTVKMATGVLSALVLALAFALPLNALTSASFRATYLSAGAPAYTELVTTSLVFLATGLALMPYVARLSCATTRYFCCEAFCTHTFYSSLDAATPSRTPTARTYGTRGDRR